MRLYSFTNMYTSGIHAGIQTAHLVHKGLFMKYYNLICASEETNFNDILLNEQYHSLIDWGDNHQTIIILNGGSCNNLELIYKKLVIFGNAHSLAYGRFHEPDLNNALTSVGIVLPESVYDYDHEEEIDCQESYLSSGENCNIETSEYVFNKFLKSFKLAN